MTATNHALTGAIIGLTVHNPWVALLAAIFSHLVCDMIPHFGMGDSSWLRRPSFSWYLTADAGLCICLVVVLAVLQPANWLLACACAFIATSPDLLWIREFMLTRRGKVYRPGGLERFLSRIQWFERPSGIAVELVWLAGSSLLLWQFI